MSLMSVISGSIGSWAIRAVSSLGLGVISYIGFSAIASQVESAAMNAINSLSAVTYQILALAGVIDALGIWFGAITAAVAFMSFKRLGVLSGS